MNRSAKTGKAVTATKESSTLTIDVMLPREDVQTMQSLVKR